MRLIDADALLEDIQLKAKNGFPANKTISVYAESCVVHAPTVDAVPVVHGRWIEIKEPDGRRYFKCSNCGSNENKHTAINGRYCWSCGAKMDLEG